MATTVLFLNNYQTTLGAALSSTATTMTVSSTTGLPASLASGQFIPMTLTPASSPGSAYEIVYVTAISGSNLTITRGEEGTSALNWNVGDILYSTNTADTTGTAMGSPSTDFQTNTLTASGLITANGGIDVAGGTLTIPNATASDEAVALGQLQNVTLLSASTTLTAAMAGTIVITVATAPTLTLPSPSSSKGITYKIINIAVGGPGASAIVTGTNIGGVLSSIKVPANNNSVTLVSDGTNWDIADFSVKSIASAYNSGSFTTVANTTTVLPFDTVTLDVLGEWDTTNHYFTPYFDGFYEVSDLVLFPANTISATGISLSLMFYEVGVSSPLSYMNTLYINTITQPNLCLGGPQILALNEGSHYEFAIITTSAMTVTASNSSGFIKRIQ